MSLFIQITVVSGYLDRTTLNAWADGGGEIFISHKSHKWKALKKVKQRGTLFSPWYALEAASSSCGVPPN